MAATLPVASGDRIYDVLLVGQIYLDTILTIPHFPEEDGKLRAIAMDQRHGGNVVNTAAVLAQLSRVQTWCMSAVGSENTTANVLQELEQGGIDTSLCFCREGLTPSSYIMLSRAAGSRTIISSHATQEITHEEFASKLNDQARRFSWVHFEGRNIDHVVEQIRWLEEKAQREGWRSQLRISVELEKPDREHIDQLLPLGDVIFFSKLFAQRRGYECPSSFLLSMSQFCKAGALLLCTWGDQGATSLQHGKTMHAESPVVTNIVDSVGAGDTFIAAIIGHLCLNSDLEIALQSACSLASRKVAQKGFKDLS